MAKEEPKKPDMQKYGYDSAKKYVETVVSTAADEYVKGFLRGLKDAIEDAKGKK